MRSDSKGTGGLGGSPGSTRGCSPGSTRGCSGERRPLAQMPECVPQGVIWAVVLSALWLLPAFLLSGSFQTNQLYFLSLSTREYLAFQEVFISLFPLSCLAKRTHFIVSLSNMGFSVKGQQIGNVFQTIEHFIYGSLWVIFPTKINPHHNGHSSV